MKEKDAIKLVLAGFGVGMIVTLMITPFVLADATLIDPFFTASFFVGSVIGVVLWFT